MTGVGKHEQDAVDLSVALLEFDAAPERLGIGRVGLSLRSVAPARATNHPVPRSEIAGSGERHLRRPAEGRMKEGAEPCEQSHMSRVTERLPPG